MAKKTQKKVDLKEIEVKEPIVVKKKIPTKTYIISLNGVKVGDKTLNIGDPINLTDKGYKYFKQKKYVK